MIIVSMGAGLGNQLFEYAFYTCLKIEFPDQIIKLDTSYAFQVAHNGIEIFNIFDLEKEIATKEEVVELTKGHYLDGKDFDRIGIIEKLYRKIGFCPHSLVIQKNYSEYYDTFYMLDRSKSWYFLGPFANYNYFKKYQDIIKNLYVFPTIQDQNNRRYAEEIASCHSVSIHIRRGDYLTVGANITPLEYYFNAMKVIEDTVDNPHYYIFSDDIAYAKDKFESLGNCTVIEGNRGKSSYRDMQLMSLCKHNIVTNSTFSFWAGFLNNNLNKIVIAPNIPHGDGQHLFVCDDWVIL